MGVFRRFVPRLLCMLLLLLGVVFVVGPRVPRRVLNGRLLAATTNGNLTEDDPDPRKLYGSRISYCLLRSSMHNSAAPPPAPSALPRPVRNAAATARATAAAEAHRAAHALDLALRPVDSEDESERGACFCLFRGFMTRCPVITRHQIVQTCVQVHVVAAVGVRQQ